MFPDALPRNLEFDVNISGNSYLGRLRDLGSVYIILDLNIVGVKMSLYLS